MTLQLVPLSTYVNGSFDAGASEIVAYDASTQWLLVTNADANTIDILDASNPSNLTQVGEIDLAPYGAGVNSVAVHQGIIAIAVEADPKQEPGQVVFFESNRFIQDSNGRYVYSLSPSEVTTVTVGALPDMLTFTPDGNRVLVANEGEPNDDYTVDPEGSVSIITLFRHRESGALADATVTTADFTAFNSQKAELQAAGVRLFGPNVTVAQDLEPEYIAVSGDGTTAWVSLQENNALGVLNLDLSSGTYGTITAIQPLGYKDLSIPGNGLDASDRDGGINIQHWPNLPLYSMYQPDSIATYIASDGQTYIVTANEGDARIRPDGDLEDADGNVILAEGTIFNEEARIGDLVLDPTVFPNAGELQADNQLGRLKVTNILGDTDGDGDYDALYAYGGRSFSIRDTAGNLIFDSGDDFERILAQVNPDNFNSTHDENGSFDDRSDDKGPEPEALTVGQVGDKIYVFIGLERDSGIMVYDVTNPSTPEFVQYISNRNFNGNAEDGTAGDLGPEGFVFVSAADSPTGEALLIVANEISGTTTAYGIRHNTSDPAASEAPKANGKQPEATEQENRQENGVGSHSWQPSNQPNGTQEATQLAGDQTDGLMELLMMGKPHDETTVVQFAEVAANPWQVTPAQTEVPLEHASGPESLVFLLLAMFRK